MNGQPNAQGTTSAPPCDVYDVAHLTGGLARVVDTAVVVLLEDGRLKADGTGRLQAEGRATHPVEAAVLDLAGPRAQRSVQTLRVRAEDDPRLTAVADRLVAAGLLRRNPLAGLRSRPTHRRTSAARQVLRQWATTPPAGTRGVDVALGGAPRTADPVLGQLVFGSLRPSAARRAGRRAAAGDPGSSTWLYAGWGGGGDGGGWGGGWGGDGGGGGCGGGDGGGGGC